MSKVQIFKTRTVKTPKRNRYDAGTDFFVPEFNEKFLDDLLKKNENNSLSMHTDENGLNYIEVDPGYQILIPSGIVVHFEDWDTYWDAENKSGVATKKGLLVGAQVVDATYSGEVHINVHNVGHEPQRIYENDKLVQFIQKRYENSEIEVYENEDEFYNLEWPGNRGSLGFGKGTGNN